MADRLTPSGVQDEERMLALLLAGGDGLPYRFRTLIEPAAGAIPSPLRRTPLDEAVQDQIGAQFPLAPLIAVGLLRAVDVPVVGPRPFLMPDDPRLGRYRAAFAGRAGWLEIAGLRLITDLRVGIHTLATSGRVWSDTRAHDGWHRSQGGGVWIYAPSLERIVSFTLVKGSGAPRGYLGVGSIF